MSPFSLFVLASQNSNIQTSSMGDTIFPLEGSSAIDTLHYNIKINWNDKNGNIDAEVLIDIRAKQKLSNFNLDFHGLTISSIKVDGIKSLFVRDKDKLNITLPSTVKRDKEFKVSINYAGVPSAMVDSVATGWETLKDGTKALSEPISAKNWFPNNNHPKDKASYTFDITVPKTYDVVANGTPSKPVVNNSYKTCHFETREPMASYLTMISIGHYELEKLKAKDGTPIYNYYYKGMKEELKKPFENQANILAFFSEKFGAYPFASAGIVASEGESILAYETQTRPFFGTPTNERMLAHEIAHQWFGNFVSLSDWKESWLKEGFATYGAALWLEHVEGKDSMTQWVKGSFESLMGIQYLPKLELKKVFKVFEIKEKMLSSNDVKALIDLGTHGKTDIKELNDALKLVPKEGISSYNLDEVFKKINFDNFKLTFNQYAKFTNIVDSKTVTNDRSFEDIVSILAEAPENVKTLEQIYSSGVYVRSSLAIHALRIEVGDDIFFKILKEYFKLYKNSTAGSKEFTQLAKKISGKNLDSFFKKWLEDKTLPDIPNYGLYKKDYSK
jgi:aminopeptidase N